MAERPELPGGWPDTLDKVIPGRNNAVVAESASMGLKTVRNHVSNKFSKMQVADRAEVIIRVRDAGVVSGSWI